MPEGRFAHKLIKYVLVVIIIFYNLLPIESTLTSDCTKFCQDQCIERTIAFPLNAYEISWPNTTLATCDFQCHVDSCRQGCTDLDEMSTCSTKCSSATDLASCQQGCRAISDNFLHQIQLLINQVTVDADLDNTQGIQLNWTFDHVHELTLKEVSAANLKWYAQSRTATGGWQWTGMGQAFRDSKLFSLIYVPVTDLPSDVWFRLAAVWKDSVVTSQSFHQNFPSLPIKSNPVLTGLLQITNNSYAVCWHTDRQSSGDSQPKFKVVLKSRSDEEPLRALETSSTCHLFRNLPSDTQFVIIVEEIGIEGGAASSQISFELKNIKEGDEKPFLVFTNGTLLMRADDLNDYTMSVEPVQLAFMLPDDKNITALSPLSQNELLVGLSDGSIHLLDLSGENGTTIQRELRPSDNTPIVQIDVDNLQEAIYFVRDTKGISRCWLRDCRNETKLETGSLQFIQSIAVDSWNGNIYYVTNNGDTSFTPLFPTTATDVYTLSITRRLGELPPVQTLQVDEVEQRLIAVLRNGSILSVDLIDKSVRDERELSDSGYHDVKRSTMYANRLFWLSTSCSDSKDEKKTEKSEEGCLRSEELDEKTQKIHLSTYIGGFGNTVRDFVIMRRQIMPAEVRSVEKLSLLLSNLKGHVTWKAPLAMPFQASSNWRSLIYECRVEEVSTDGMKEIASAKNINATELVFPAEASHSYKTSVRACIRPEICSEWSNITNSALANDQLDKIVVYVKTVDGLGTIKVNLLGEEVLDEKAPNISQYIQQYLTDTNQKQLDLHTLVDFDSKSRLLYLATSQNGSIYRLNIDGQYTKLWDFLSIRHMALMSSQAMIFVASSYQIAAYRFTSSFYKTVYNCVGESCAATIGLAVDAQASTLYYLLKNTNGTVELHSLKIGSEDSQAQLVAITDKFPQIRQIASLGAGRLALITEDGHVGICDQRLSNLNYNNAIKDVQFLIQMGDSDSIPQLGPQFESGIEFQSADKAELSWSTTPELSLGQALYKVQLFQDGVIADRTVDMTLSLNYTLPSAVLKKWCSKQKFDVQIDVITAWTITTAKKSALIAPTKPPSSPTNLRIYATQQKTVDGTRAMIDLFWDAPTEWNGDMLGFLVQCNATGGEEAKTTMVANANLTTRHTRSFFFPTTSGRISCAVAARNEQELIGAFSEEVSIDSSEFRPLVRLFAIDSTSSLLAIYNWSSPMPSPNAENTDSTKLNRARRESDSAQYQSVAYICNELYAVRKESDSTQPFLVLLDINDVSNVIHKVSINGDLQEITAMTSDWVANRLLFVGNQDLMQITLDNLESQSVVTPKQLITLSVGAQDAKQLTFDPFTNTAYLLSKNGSLFSLNLNKKVESNLGLHLECLKSQTVTAIVAEFVWNKAASPTLFALTWNGMISIDPSSMKCSEVNIDWAQFGGSDDELSGLKSVTSFSVIENFFIFVTATKLYAHSRITGPVTQIPIINPPLKQVLAASHSAQPYPDRQCFALPSPSNINFTVKNEDRTGAVIEVLNEATIAPSSSCSNISFPQTQYQIYFKRKDSEKIKNLQSIQRLTHIENGFLDKETDYTIRVAWFNRYYTPSGVSETKHLRTGYGYPTAPLDPKAFSLTPDTVLLYWKLPQALNAPANEIKYKIKQSNTNQLQPVAIGAKQFLNGNFSVEFSDIVGCSQDPCQAKIPNLRPATDYQFWVSALHIQRINLQLPEDNAAISVETKTRTKDLPGTLRAENATSDSLTLKFTSLEPEIAPREIYVRYRETILNHQAAIEAAWIQAPNSTFDPLANPQVNLTIDDLRSATSYDYQFVALYAGSYEYDNENKTFNESYYHLVSTARTKAGTPAPPEDVRLERDAESWYLRWTKPANNGGLPLTFYAIDFRKNSTSDWTIAERGLPAKEQLRWRIDKKLVDDLKQVEFRVRAYNAEGFGDYAYTEPEHEKNAESVGHDFWLWPLVIVSTLFMILICGCLTMLLIARNRRHKAKLRKLEIHKEIKLEQFGQIQYYESPAEFPMEIQNEIRNLHKIPLHKLEIKDELGKGSFGVVSKGILKEWEPMGKKSITVAIKQMKGCCKGVSRSHFLKEAILMNNFDHPNIIKLLGVCLEDPNDHMLIMEFMEGGDLHAFLRGCNNRSIRPKPSLRMRDLISMMIDVCRATAYLESNKHVHRDIAARNCLISSKMSQNRVTKISDFGMAREIYSSDYYRLNGEDLLPLRWLSPEACQSGLFTSKSDVWAFGVLLYEIVSLGEKPYASFDNSRVLAALECGQNPGCPIECPDEIHEIMLQTWIVDAKERPSFSQILPQLERLRGKSEIQAIDPKFLKREFYSHENSGFDNSTGSNSSRSEAVHFNKSDTRNRGMMPQSMRRRQSNQQQESDFYRADSAETFMTSATDYETPRSASLSAHGTASYPFGSQLYSDSTVSAGYGFAPQTQRQFSYNNDAYLNEDGSENNPYEILNRSGPPFRHKSPHLSNVPSAPNLHPSSSTPASIQSDLPTRKMPNLVSRV